MTDLFVRCGHCKQLAPEYEIAARELSNYSVSFAAVDCDENPTLAQQFGVKGFPTIKVCLLNCFS